MAERVRAVLSAGLDGMSARVDAAAAAPATAYEAYVRNILATCPDGSRHDWDHVPWYPRGYEWRDEQCRERATREFGFAILTRRMVQALLPHGPFLEVGAGTGYWAYELASAGADVIATDSGEEARLRGWTRSWHEVLAADAVRAVERISSTRTLLVVWPTGFAGGALAAYRGRRLVYAGESRDGCTADDWFFDQLERDWEEECEIPMPRWDGIHDYCAVYRRTGPRRRRQHCLHDIHVVDEYGVESGTCGASVVCRECGARSSCGRSANHDGEHGVRR